MFGFMAIAIALFLASVCVINMVSKINFTITRRFTDYDTTFFARSQRMEEERFKRIDAKRGGRGFV